tara:strand:+ start:7260 stop:7676 length:417 start_codon:yes stop_codon:yes gene_type:complete
MSGKKSRDKGARGEREAAAYLTKLGFESERNGRNGYSTDDLRVPGLPNVHIEVKFGYESMGLGGAVLRHAWEQAMANRPEYGGYEVGSGAPIFGDGVPVVLWRPLRKPWRLTWMAECGLVTTCGDDEIKSQLLRLNGA